MSSSHDGSQDQPTFVERRRHPRRRPAADIAITLRANYNAEVLDISGGGALISTPAHLIRGQRGSLRTLLAREPFSAVVEVLRVDVGTRNGGERRNHAGLGFVSLDDNSRKTLQRFIKDPKSR
jgi:c-di-GMP-binding flagellar brake protein YcgR